MFQLLNKIFVKSHDILINFSINYICCSDIQKSYM